MARSSTMRSHDIGPAIAGLLLMAVLLIALGLFVVRVAPPIHGLPGVGEPARQFFHRVFPAQPLPDRHPQVARPATASGD